MGAVLVHAQPTPHCLYSLPGATAMYHDLHGFIHFNIWCAAPVQGEPFDESLSWKMREMAKTGALPVTHAGAPKLFLFHTPPAQPLLCRALCTTVVRF